ncbi:hypothetical protein BH23BAC3_BH23BAC3_01690 [soil metagenome]
MPDPVFLSLEDILYIHEQEIKTAGGEPNIRDFDKIKLVLKPRKPALGVSI